MSRAPALPLLLALALALSACTSSGSGPAADDAAPTGGGSADRSAVALTRPSGASVVSGAGGAVLASATSKALYDRSPVVAVAGEGDRAGQARAASFAVAAGVPLLLSPATGTAATASPTAGPTASPTAGTGGRSAQDELERLEPQAVLAFGPDAVRWSEQAGGEAEVVPAPDDAAALTDLAQGRLGAPTATPADGLPAAVAALPLSGTTPLLAVEGTPPAASGSNGGSEAGELPRLPRPQRARGLVVLASTATPDALAAIATARAAGAQVQLLTDPDPRGSAAAVKALSTGSPPAVLALGDGFGSTAQLREQVAVAATGVELPGGGQRILPGKLYVALYGHPGSDALGVLGEQGVEETVARAKRVAAEYEQAGSAVPVVPTFEIITTVASSALGDGDYSDESEVEHVRPLVEAAGRAGVYVVLDLQPGYDDFLTQAKLYEELLALPHVGLALDPEWRLRPGERHMEQIGRVGADEVNAVVTWLADLTRQRRLPQKLLLLHQFKTFMLEDRQRIDLSQPELSVVTQMDGHGSPGTKQETWNVLRPGSAPQMRWGWKNFYDEDTPMLTARQTLAVQPTPVFVSYQ